jgi:tripartite-type tricarboxylate transporter receptor subunit TctC
MRGKLLAAYAIVLALVFGLNAHATDYPSRPIRIIVPFAPGGSLDLLARSLGPQVGSELGQPIVVENRSGAGGNIGIDAVARSQPDGYTLLIASEPLTINPSLYRDVRFDPVRDFAPVTLLARVAQVIILDPRLPAQDLRGLIAAARARPQSINVASAGVGSTGHLAAAMLGLANVPVVHVPYRGGGPATAAVVSGDVQSGILTLPAALGFIRSGTVRVVAVTSTARSRFLPDVPTLAEALPGVEVDSWQAVFAPAGTPAGILARLNAAFIAVVTAPDVTETLLRQGFEPAGSPAAELGTLVRTEAAKWPAIIHATGMQAN